MSDLRGTCDLCDETEDFCVCGERAVTLEEAAMVCDGIAADWEIDLGEGHEAVALECAKAIRSLIPSPTDAAAATQPHNAAIRDGDSTP
jgi:hypothetical protein